VVDALDRRLVAVMFTDMAGYTALLQADSVSHSSGERGTGTRSNVITRRFIRATEAGLTLTIAETLELARPGNPAPA
jgi:hypothetical protein